MGVIDYGERMFSLSNAETGTAIDWINITSLVELIGKKAKSTAWRFGYAMKDAIYFGKYSVHKNAEVMQYLHRYGQEKCMKEQNWTVEQFVAEFGKNYLDWKE